MAPSSDKATEGGLRRGQAMVETVLALLVVTFLFFVLFGLSQLLNRKILLEHAAMRVARARAVGFNDFMCLKTARVAVIPISGKRLWPVGETWSDATERDRASTYLETPDASWADGLLEYEGWKHLTVLPGDGDAIVRLKADGLELEGRAGIGPGYSYFMEAGGR